jgi:hypothetical protein
VSHDKDNLRNLNNRSQSIEIKEHPPELMELDEETVAIAKAKLAGFDFENIYGDEDRSSSELMIRNQRQKIRELFQTADELRIAFSSEQKTTQTKKDMVIDGIDLEFVKRYCLKKQLNFASDAEALIRVGFENDIPGEANV